MRVYGFVGQDRDPNSNYGAGLTLVIVVLVDPSRLWRRVLCASVGGGTAEIADLSVISLLPVDPTCHFVIRTKRSENQEMFRFANLQVRGRLEGAP